MLDLRIRGRKAIVCAASKGITRTALGCSGLGWLPALDACTRPSERLSASACAICDRALLPVHRNSSRAAGASAAAPGTPGTLASSRSSPGCSDRPVTASSPANRGRSAV